MPLMKNCSRLLAALSLVLAVLASCAKNTQITGKVADAPNSKLVLKLLDVNRYRDLDTLHTDAQGAFSYGLDIAAGEPEFLYLFYGNRQIASLLLEKGDKVHVETDTLGAYQVAGSEESVRLQKVENAYNACIRDMSKILSRPGNPDAALSRRYIAYYRDRVSYVLANPHSLTVVPVFFQQLNDGLPVFGQPTDGILMRQVCDSLMTLYPESRYVKALDKEAARRIQEMELGFRLQNAEEVGYVDMELPGMEGTPVKLSDHVGKVTMLYFWSTTTGQKMFNLDALVPLYEEFHDKGFEIYAVALDTDKSGWAAAVRNQNLPWVNVCDTRGAGSPYLGLYMVESLPTAVFLVDGEVDPAAGVKDAATIKAYLKKKL